MMDKVLQHKTNWQLGETVKPEDLNRMENNDKELSLSLSQNEERITELEDLTPVWQEFIGYGNIKIDNSFDGTVKDMIVKGQTLQNLNLLGEVLDFYAEGTTWIHTGYRNEFLLKAGEEYSICVTCNIQDFRSFQFSHANGLSPEQVSLSKGDLGKWIKFTAREITSAGIGYVINNNSGGGWTKIEKDSVRVIIVKGDMTDKPTVSYFDSIVSSGENEGNKIIIKSIGKNLFDFANSTSLTGTNREIELQNSSWASAKFKTNRTTGILSISYYDKCNIDGKNPRMVVFYKDGTKQQVNGASTLEYTKRVIKTQGKDIDYIGITWSSGGGVYSIKDLMIEENTVATEYEPYKFDKKEILLPFEGGLKELDIVDFENGKIYENSINHLITDSKISIHNNGTEYIRFRVNIPNGKNSGNPSYILYNKIFYCSTLKVNKDVSGLSSDVEIKDECIFTGIGLFENDIVGYISLPKSKLETPDINGFKKWLQANPTTIVYEANIPTIHNIEKSHLKTYNRTTHIIQENSLSGEVSFKVAKDRDATINQLNKRIEENAFDIDLNSNSIKEIILALANCIKKDGSITMEEALLLACNSGKGLKFLNNGVPLSDIWADGNGNIQIKIGGIDKISFNTDGIAPQQQKILDLGNPTNMWRDIWVGTHNKGDSGINKDTNGFIKQWGTIKAIGDGFVTFPSAFPTRCIYVTATVRSVVNAAASQGVTTDGYERERFQYRRGDSTGGYWITWEAWGY